MLNPSNVFVMHISTGSVHPQKGSVKGHKTENYVKFFDFHNTIEK